MQPEYVLYWALANRRIDSNRALAHAAQLANQAKLPLLIYEALTCSHPWANDRFHTFILEGVPDNAKRAAIEHEMQTLEYNNGGYIIWGFSTLLDGYSTKVAGLLPGNKGVLPLNGFGNGYRTIWFA